ncbi:glycosyltransferase [Deinococcus koreensis]|uniref:Glycosyl transferase family 1 n=1 Tax=Deinococcus koreensis TaxID=2054903 RepID=A0A2K3UTA4_9DEIO|nr:glycosyltransferase [Deinococcus koreensis]PNY79773.1 glycosyl transferase family 1 [Deinococcus koreensis]
MKVVMAHTFYKQKGGEDESYRAESRLLEDHGHRVERFERHNRDLDGVAPARMAQMTIWNQACARELAEVVARERADVVHFQNTFPVISPAAYSAARRAGAAVVQSLRNYRHSCVNGLLFRNGQICEACTGKSLAWPGVRHRCYRQSTVASAVVASMQSAHKLIGTYDHQVDLYIAVSEFVRRKYIEFGLPPEKIVVKPNFVYPDPGPRFDKRPYAVYAGRLSEEKGVARLVETWLREAPGLELCVVGEGPQRARLEALAGGGPQIRFLGARPLQETYDLIGEASFVVVPSEWYEPFGRTAVEGLAKGTPVICADIGGLSEIIQDGVTGFKFRAGDSRSLAHVLHQAAARWDDGELRRRARREFERRYSASANLDILMRAYRTAWERRQGS